MAQKAKDKAPYVAKTNQSSNGHDIAFNKKVSVGDMDGKKQGLQTIQHHSTKINNFIGGEVNLSNLVAKPISSQVEKFKSLEVI